LENKEKRIIFFLNYLKIKDIFNITFLQFLKEERKKFEKFIRNLLESGKKKEYI